MLTHQLLRQYYNVMIIWKSTDTITKGTTRTVFIQIPFHSIKWFRRFSKISNIQPTKSLGVHLGWQVRSPETI